MPKADTLVQFDGPLGKQRELRLPALPCPRCTWPLIKYVYPDPDGGGIGADARWVYYWCCDKCEILGQPGAYTEAAPPVPPPKKGK